LTFPAVSAGMNCGVMNFQDLVRLYERYKSNYGTDAYKHISALLKEAKAMHKRDWEKAPTPAGDHEQSWRGFKGKNLEKLILYIVADQVKMLGLEIVAGDTLERTQSKNLSSELKRVKRNLLIDYGEFGAHLPDVDIVVYDPETCAVLAVISSKVTLRERIAQTGYWKIKLSQDEVTERIKVYFVTPDEDRDMSKPGPVRKGRAVVEVDTDGTYVMTEEQIIPSAKVKTFDQLVEDLRKLKEGTQANG